MEKKYPGCVRDGFEPFDPLSLASWTEEIVCKDSMRKYTEFYCTGVYGGISTGYTVGCCLRCVFCWVNLSRDFPQEFGKFYAPEDVFKELLKKAEKKGVKKMRVSGGEPTLCRSHLLKLFDLIEETDYIFILETNGILLGNDEGYVKMLAKYKNIHVRVSIKAGTPDGLQKRTGAIGSFYELPFNAIKYLMEEKMPFHVAAMSDPRLMPPDERGEMLKRLKEVGYKGFVKEETCDPYPHAVYRLREVGLKIY